MKLSLLSLRRLLTLAVLTWLAALAGPAAAVDVTNVNDNGAGSLRAAVANTPANGTISFSIGNGQQKIMLNSMIAITKPVILNGTPPANMPTQSVVLDGTNAAAGMAVGLFISANGCTIANLTVTNFKTSAVAGQDGDGTGILINNTVPNALTPNVIQGCRLISNQGDGLWIVGGSNNIIGVGVTPNGQALLGAGNVISGNGRNGIRITPYIMNQNTVFSANGNQVGGNLIGIDPTGLGKMPNALDGVRIDGSLFPSNVMKAARVVNPMANSNIIGIGTALPGYAIPPAMETLLRNVIAGNTMNGVNIMAPVGVNNTSNNEVKGNLIGTNTVPLGVLPGLALPPPLPGLAGALVLSPLLGNGGDGVRVQNGVGNLVGGRANNANAAQTAQRRKNVIAYNSGKGVNLKAGTGQSIDPNSLFANGGGIDLDDEPTPEQPEGSGANLLIHAPILTQALSTGGGTGTQVQFVIDSSLNYPIHVEFFDNNGPDPAGQIEGETFLGETDVPVADSLGNPYTISLPPAGLITATATDADGDTSEFSVRIVVSSTTSDASSRVQVKRGGYRFYNALGMYVQVITLTNTGTTSIPGPVSLVLDSLSPSATIFNQDGTTMNTAPVGSPYVNFVSNADTLAAGKSASFVLVFSDPSNTGITYTTRVLAGAGMR